MSYRRFFPNERLDQQQPPTAFLALGTQFAVFPLMFVFSDSERTYLDEEIRTDGQGRQILVGLTFEETAEFWRLVRLAAGGERLGDADKYRYRVLSLKLEDALGQR